LPEPGAGSSVVRACGEEEWPWRDVAGQCPVHCMPTLERGDADPLSEEPGFVDYQVMDTGDGTVTSVTIFEDEERCLRSNDMAAAFVREHLRDFQIERLDVFGGEVMVSRAAERVLEPAHH
jgi:hypothetical protein